MKNKFANAFLLMLLYTYKMGFSQADSARSIKLPSIAMVSGGFSYRGDLNTEKISPFSFMMPFYGLQIEQRFKKKAALCLNYQFGEVKYAQREVVNSLNFKSSINHLSLDFKYYLGQHQHANEVSMWNPYLDAGFGYLTFNPMGDLKDSQGRDYHYWSDGTVRDLQESEENEKKAKMLERDYIYESSLNNSPVKYKNSAITIPVGAGIKFNLSEAFAVDFSYTHFFTNTDFLDNVSVSKAYDGINRFGLGLSFYPGYTRNKKAVDSVTFDFSALEKSDQDLDGVVDMTDDCPHTPAGIQVDKKGCPEDKDDDGVFDYQDKELNTEKGSLVDRYGVALCDSAIAEKFGKDSLIEYEINFERIEVKDSTYDAIMELIRLKEQHASLSSVSPAEIPAVLKIADFDQDGRISGTEIMKAIDAFFDSDKQFSVDIINQLIAYFFKN